MTYFSLKHWCMIFMVALLSGPSPKFTLKFIHQCFSFNEQAPRRNISQTQDLGHEFLLFYILLALFNVIKKLLYYYCLLLLPFLLLCLTWKHWLYSIICHTFSGLQTAGSNWRSIQGRFPIIRPVEKSHGCGTAPRCRQWHLQAARGRWLRQEAGYWCCRMPGKGTCTQVSYHLKAEQVNWETMTTGCTYSLLPALQIIIIISLKWLLTIGVLSTDFIASIFKILLHQYLSSNS